MADRAGLAAAFLRARRESLQPEEDRLQDTPAQVVNHLGGTLKQTRPAGAARRRDGAHGAGAQCPLPVIHRPRLPSDPS